MPKDESWPPPPKSPSSPYKDQKTTKLSTGKALLDILAGGTIGGITNFCIYLLLLFVGNIIHPQHGPLEEGTNAYAFGWMMWAIALLGTLWLPLLARRVGVYILVGFCLGVCCMAGFNAMVILLLSG